MHVGNGHSYVRSSEIFDFMYAIALIFCDFHRQVCKLNVAFLYKYCNFVAGHGIITCITTIYLYK